MTEDALVHLVADLGSVVACGRRHLLGVAGPPGSGKSTFAAALAEELNAASSSAGGEPVAVVLPMDGFHLSAAELERRGLTERKGAPHTFDAAAFVELLAALRRGISVRAPVYDRTLHDVAPGALAIPAGTALVIVEGNYLLLAEPPWRPVADLLDEAWYLDVAIETCLGRVYRRHIAGGRSEAEAARKIAGNDRPNAELVATTRARADRIITGG